MLTQFGYGVASGCRRSSSWGGRYVYQRQLKTIVRVAAAKGCLAHGEVERMVRIVNGANLAWHRR